ncbi:hypothetical protein TQ29_14095 [Actibacterium sp. EMB200-NS6]|nr:hypothetical protein TQ29_14095 [Actibacterium sp. EMB200-NS6]
MSCLALIAKARRRGETPVSVHRSGAHAIGGLFAVLLTLVLRDRGEQVFNEDRVRVFAEGDGGAFKLAADVFQRAAQRPVALNVAREAADIINNDDNAVARFGLNKGDQVIEGGAIHQTAGHTLFVKGANDFVSFALRIFAAARGLRVEAVAFFNLFGGGDAAVNDGGVRFCL